LTLLTPWITVDFSYHITGGNHVLCDLQGGIYQYMIVLSDPVILSRTRQYGVTDLGPAGISSFFSQHSCNKYCRPHWYVHFPDQEALQSLSTSKTNLQSLIKQEVQSSGAPPMRSMRDMDG
jgi:hypothetical protein